MTSVVGSATCELRRWHQHANVALLVPNGTSRASSPTAGKVVLPCAVETWGRVDGRLDGLLDDLAVLAAHRQRERGLLPTRWRAEWRTQISVQLALGVSRALLDALPAGVKPCGPLRSRE